jgi:hypothetical protein
VKKRVAQSQFHGKSKPRKALAELRATWWSLED